MADEYEEKVEEDGLEKMKNGGGATQRERERERRIQSVWWCDGLIIIWACFLSIYLFVSRFHWTTIWHKVNTIILTVNRNSEFDGRREVCVEWFHLCAIDEDMHRSIHSFSTQIKLNHHFISTLWNRFVWITPAILIIKLMSWMRGRWQWWIRESNKEKWNWFHIEL